MISLKVFVSYATRDLSLANAVAEALEAREYPKVEILLDRRIDPGCDFNEEIRSSIRRSHLIMCLLTENSVARMWVQHEIAYALGLNIPVVPLAWGKASPRGMAFPLQAYNLRGRRKVEIAKELAHLDLVGLVSSYSNRLPLTELAHHAEKRTALLVHHARELLRTPPRIPVQLRQRAVMSSFSIPSWNEDDPRWKTYTEVERSLGHFELARQERIALEAHAALAGVRLIVCPMFRYKTRLSTIGKLEQLKEFLEDHRDKPNVEVVTTDFPSGNVTIVGGSFVAEAPPPAALSGIRGTLFNFHAPSVLDAIRHFDEDFRRIELSANLGTAANLRDWWLDYTLRKIAKAPIIAKKPGRWSSTVRV